MSGFDPTYLFIVSWDAVNGFRTGNNVRILPLTTINNYLCIIDTEHVGKTLLFLVS